MQKTINQPDKIGFKVKQICPTFSNHNFNILLSRDRSLLVQKQAQQSKSGVNFTMQMSEQALCLYYITIAICHLRDIHSHVKQKKSHSLDCL